jgi:hypothetical protein
VALPGKDALLQTAELGNVVAEMGAPDALTLDDLRSLAEAGNIEALVLTDKARRRRLPLLLAECGYVVVLNDLTKDKQWVVGGRRQRVYAKASLSIAEQYRAARALR